jgi:hypothetical protein
MTEVYSDASRIKAEDEDDDGELMELQASLAM